MHLDTSICNQVAPFYAMILALAHYSIKARHVWIAVLRVAWCLPTQVGIEYATLAAPTNYLNSTEPA
jgi:hypothetical protein